LLIAETEIRDASQSLFLSAIADHQAGAYSIAIEKFRRLEKSDPSNFQYFARRVEVAVDAGQVGIISEIVEAVELGKSDSIFLWAIGVMLRAGKTDDARNLITKYCDGTGRLEACALAEARVLERCGDEAFAMVTLEPYLAAEKPNLQLLRAYYRLNEAAARYDVCFAVSARCAVLHGDMHDLRYAIDLATLFFRFVDADELISQFNDKYRERTIETSQIAAEFAVVRAAASAALVEHNGLGATRDQIVRVLKDTSAVPSEILWAKQSLIAFVTSATLTEENLVGLEELSINWEDPRVRNYILRIAIDRFPNSRAIQERWARWLLAQRRFVEAGVFVDEHLGVAPSEVMLFIGAMLLNVSRCAIVPSFLTAAQKSRIFEAVSTGTADMNAGFRSFMHEQLGMLGIDAGPWPLAKSYGDASDPSSFVRFLGRKTGRLHRVEVNAHPERDLGRKFRPIVAVSGQLRGFETAWPSIFRFVAEPLNAPIVLTTWSTTKNAQGRHGRRLDRLLTTEIQSVLAVEDRFSDVFQSRYPKTFALLFGETEVDVSSIEKLVVNSGVSCLGLEAESDLALVDALSPAFDDNMLKMFYKWSRADSLIASVERRAGELFSHVVWLRPDCKINFLPMSTLFECMLRDDVVYSSWGTDASVGDYIMVLPREAFSAVGSVFSRVTAAGNASLFPWRPYSRRRDTLSPPETIFDVLLSEGYSPFGRIGRIMLQLVGRVPPSNIISQTFFAEREARAN
jgi:hypothetical protein